MPLRVLYFLIDPVKEIPDPLDLRFIGLDREIIGFLECVSGRLELVAFFRGSSQFDIGEGISGLLFYGVFEDGDGFVVPLTSLMFSAGPP